MDIFEVAFPNFKVIQTVGVLTRYQRSSIFCEDKTAILSLTSSWYDYQLLDLLVFIQWRYVIDVLE